MKEIDFGGIREKEISAALEKIAFFTDTPLHDILSALEGVCFSEGECNLFYAYLEFE
jgi:hypothetical protein